MKKIGIIGGGFAGTMTAVQLIQQASEAFEIYLINERETLNRGIAYTPYSNKQILNVVTGKMSAFPDQPDHFLDWVMKREDFADKDRNLIANAFLPRRLYGEYLCETWQASLHLAAEKQVKVTEINCFVVDLDLVGDHVSIWLNNDEKLTVDDCVIATGNQVPRNPTIRNEAFYQNKNYFQNPWKVEAVKATDGRLPVLIIGNGLTMVDTVLGLLEHGHKGEIVSISPNGFNILMHRHNGLKYTKLVEELQEGLGLLDLVKLVNKHVKSVREHGVSAEPVIDALRPYTQKIWQSLTADEKSLFMSRLRHLWGVARHRIPVHTYDKIQQLRIDGKLSIRAGRLLDLQALDDAILVEYFDKKDAVTKQFKVARVINCTGPETDLMRLEKNFLKNCLIKGILTQDSLKLGIRANTDTYQIIGSDGSPHSHLYTMGSNLKGELWESTAVNELRTQAEKLAKRLAVKAGVGVLEV